MCPLSRAPGPRTQSQSSRGTAPLLPQLLLLLVACTAQGVIVGSTLGVSGPPTRTRDHPGGYKIVSPSLLNGEPWHPLSGIPPQDHPVRLSFQIEVDGKELIIHLERNEGLLADNFTTTHYQGDGTDVSLAQNYTGHCYYHGHVQGHPDSAVSLSTCSGLRGLLLLGSQAYILEPLKDAAGQHKLQPAETLKTAWGACGQQYLNISGRMADGEQWSPHTFTRRRKRETLKTTKYVELVIVADNREFQRQGKDVEKVKQRLIEIANHVDKFYRPLNIRIVLVGVEVWNDIDKCSISQDPFTSLHEFLDWRKMKLLPRKPHDNAQLVSGVYFQGTTIGMAPIMSMCTAEQSGGVVMDHSESPLGAAVTLAHELGHNLGMNHDTLERGCHCQAMTDKGGCIMNPSTGYPFPVMFSSCSKRDLETSLEKGMGVCLFNLPDIKESFGGQKCGNGYVEEGEECDCGEPDECTNPCCNATTCTLKPEAVCAHGLCCENCQLKPAGTACRASSNSCDLPEFCTGAKPHCPANVYLHDGHQCHRVDGYCYNGICQTHEQQCVTLWGPGAKPAPGICFERVNSAGDPYGNCGKDSKSSFEKCEMRDAKCGKIQCQGGASRPVIGTNAVSIETNIPLQEGGKILCRGTHVYLGDDLPDPGLVLAGTKCEDGKLCLNRRCQNISVFGVHECATKCHGRGVCNSNKNCHCEADWAPPFCDKPGFGGSIDSGPIRQADKRGLTVGILVTFLCLLVAGFITYLKRKTLIQLLFTNKKTKTTIEKLRCVRPARPSSVTEPNHSRTTNLSHGLLRKPPHTSVPKKENCRRLPKYQNIDISNPVKSPDTSPPRPQLPRHQNVPVRPLPANPPIRQAQGMHKPSPPQKPLPADPLSKITRLNEASRKVPGQQEAGHRIIPMRPAPQHPPQVPRPSYATCMK
ncbi:disintegrin and metalloproteinase domain-containing protein 12 [Dromiciops gliroides]|uniref:disintegrin and metalloproteinase domain-containing protein 12 n=1 Tax=Dromiciops gliroides TaxID=33562 RepID=UPI001CC5D7DD|nr:disintegrin and metalloproteinase domain-containing protein 12 [Dromiciops gliroides]